uniref:Secreted protein n=1 Tax=Haemonchus placei TaxID=6290 RepID=A0A0N4WDS5_HAEPC
LERLPGSRLSERFIFSVGVRTISLLSFLCFFFCSIAFASLADAPRFTRLNVIERPPNTSSCSSNSPCCCMSAFFDAKLDDSSSIAVSITCSSRNLRALSVESNS